jgi:SAM-dependent methyltransferase
MDNLEYTKMFDHEKSYWWFVTKRLFIHTFLSYLPEKKNKKILDAGCGTGGNISLLQHYGKVLAIDVSSTAIAFCKKRGFISVLNASIEKLPFHTNSFDLITLFDVLYHKRIHNDVETLRYLHSFVKPQGYLLITDCAFQFLYGDHDRNNHARTRYSLPELKEKLQQSGFTVIRGSYIFCFPFLFFVVNRFLTSIGVLSASKSEMNIHPIINSYLLSIEKIENKILQYINLPFGSSVIILAQKR